MDNIIKPDTQSILLLCGRFNDESLDVSPLTQSEYYKLVSWMTTTGLKPSDLLESDDLSRFLEDVIIAGIVPERIIKLLQRKDILASEIERWTESGLWIISQFDKAYPSRFKERLGAHAPPILYGAGESGALDKGGLAIVGSRDVDEDGRTFARETAAGCARIDVQVISGGARGVDGEAMSAALEEGGKVVGILADTLERRAASGDSRDLITSGRLTLISQTHPKAGFQAGLAMARNKLIYALSDRALVVSSEFGSGGTWSGARDNLKAGWVPLYVRSGDDVPDGNRKLIKLGAYEACRDLGQKVIEFPGWRNVPASDYEGEVRPEEQDGNLNDSGKRQVDLLM